MLWFGVFSKEIESNQSSRIKRKTDFVLEHSDWDNAVFRNTWTPLYIRDGYFHGAVNVRYKCVALSIFIHSMEWCLLGYDVMVISKRYMCDVSTTIAWNHTTRLIVCFYGNGFELNARHLYLNGVKLKTPTYKNNNKTRKAVYCIYSGWLRWIHVHFSECEWTERMWQRAMHGVSNLTKSIFQGSLLLCNAFFNKYIDTHNAYSIAYSLANSVELNYVVFSLIFFFVLFLIICYISTGYFK